MRFLRPVILSGLTVFVVVAALAISLREFTTGPASAADEAVAVDCDASTSAIDNDCTYNVGDVFQIAVHATNADSGYAGYQVKPRWTDDILEYIAGTAQNLWPEPSASCPAAINNQPVDPSVVFGCFTFPVVTSTYTGVLAEFEMACEAAGPTALTLVPSLGDGQGGTNFSDDLGTLIDPALTNADVTCLDTSTPTAPATATPTSCAMLVAPGVQQLAVGESGGFDVELSECSNVAGVSFLLNFDASIMRVDDRSGEPAFPTDCGVPVDTIDNDAGLLHFACVTAPLSGSNGGGVVAHYDVTCLSEGISPLSLKETRLVDSLVRPIPHAVQDGLFACVSPLATPLSTETTTPIQTPTSTATPPLTSMPTVTPTATQTATATPTNTPTTTSMPTNTPTPTPAAQPGDVNCDGQVTSIDAALVLQLDAALIDLLSCQDAADLNGDGVIDALDALFILWMAAGLI